MRYQYLEFRFSVVASDICIIKYTGQENGKFKKQKQVQ